MRFKFKFKFGGGLGMAFKNQDTTWTNVLWGDCSIQPRCEENSTFKVMTDSIDTGSMVPWFHATT